MVHLLAHNDKFSIHFRITFSRQADFCFYILVVSGLARGQVKHGRSSETEGIYELHGVCFFSLILNVLGLSSIFYDIMLHI
ncbi:hypothetical protein ACN38_g9897 [Penicillium nordicum]|uniref:Uncharacterized protein n=1 Tax=Penicillium nordicum TaxID=229535 RepID=A0A0N0RXY4_9EURO|nr:hypothetical protein ACN38_g9897 [Penicillium nordicum]